MIEPTPELDELERRWPREELAGMSYREALSIFEGLWLEAQALNPDFPGDWRDDLPRISRLPAL
jgi:hypothetical protein